MTVNSILHKSRKLIQQLEHRLQELETTNDLLEKQQLDVIVHISQVKTEHEQGSLVVTKLKDIFGAIPS